MYIWNQYEKYIKMSTNMVVCGAAVLKTACGVVGIIAFSFRLNLLLAVTVLMFVQKRKRDENLMGY